MPVLPPAGTAPYDTGEYVLELARAIANDAQISIAGNLLADSQPYTLPLLNSAFRQLQDKLANAGIETLVKEALLTPILPVAVNDPSVQTWLGWTGYWDGATRHAAPVLPIDMILPLRLWERQTGSTGEQYHPMKPVNDGLPTLSQTSFLRFWEWRQDQINFIGANQSNDIRIRYRAYLPDLGATTDPVPIMRAAEAMAYYVAAKFAEGRGSQLAADLAARGDLKAEQIIARSAQRRQRGQRRRVPYGGMNRYSASWWGW